MGKRILLSVAVGGLLILGIGGAFLAGVGPSPFEPEINKLHSIGISVAIINKRLAKVDKSETLTEETINYLNAMANRLHLLSRLEKVLLVLPFDIAQHIVSRMGIEPSPWLPLFRNVPIGIIEGINIHVFPVLPPLPPPQLPVLP
jgi:hypothetical protein